MTKRKKLFESIGDKVIDLYYRIPYDYRLGPMWQMMKDFWWNRYSTVKPRTLDHSWCDRRELLLHMSMEILGQFIEKECSPGDVTWFGEEGPKIGDKYVMDEMKEIWDWWNIIYQKEYPEDTDNIWKLVSECSPKILHEELDPPHSNFRQMIFHFETDEQKTKYKALTAKVSELEREIEEKSDEMLQRLAAVRQYMWT